MTPSLTNIKRILLVIVLSASAPLIGNCQESVFVKKGMHEDTLKNYPEAIKYYNKAIELNPKDTIAYEGLGAAEYKLKNFEKAIQYLNKAIELYPKYEIAYVGRAI